MGDDESCEFWRGVDAAAEAVRKWPAWKRGEWREYPATKPMTVPLTRDEARELLAEGKRIRGEVEARVDAMERGLK